MIIMLTIELLLKNNQFNHANNNKNSNEDNWIMKKVTIFIISFKLNYSFFIIFRPSIHHHLPSVTKPHLYIVFSNNQPFILQAIYNWNKKMCHWWWQLDKPFKFLSLSIIPHLYHTAMKFCHTLSTNKGGENICLQTTAQ